MQNFPTFSWLRTLEAAHHGATESPVYSYVAASRRSPSGFVCRFRFPKSLRGYGQRLARASRVPASVRVLSVKGEPERVFEFSFPVEASSARPEWLKLFGPAPAELYREE